MIRLWTAALLVTVAISLAEARQHNEQHNRLKKEYLAKLRSRLARRGMAHAQHKRDDDCKARYANCTGYAWDRCCGDDTCYWETGRELLKPGKEGYCVDCIRNGQVCQFDWQCCEEDSLVCHREDKFDLNGACGPKRPKGGICHEDDNCLSDDCDLSWTSGFTKGVCDD